MAAWAFSLSFLYYHISQKAGLIYVHFLFCIRHSRSHEIPCLQWGRECGLPRRRQAVSCLRQTEGGWSFLPVPRRCSVRTASKNESSAFFHHKVMPETDFLKQQHVFAVHIFYGKTFPVREGVVLVQTEKQVFPAKRFCDQVFSRGSSGRTIKW